MFFLPLFGGAGSGLTINCTLGTADASGFTANVDKQINITGIIGTATASGFTASVDLQFTITGIIGTATASGFTATVELSIPLYLTTAQAIRLEAIFRRHGLIDPLV